MLKLFVFLCVVVAMVVVLSGFFAKWYLDREEQEEWERAAAIESVDFED